MKSSTFFSLLFVFAGMTSLFAQTTQPCDGLYYFYENTSISSWTGNAGIYKGGDATFVTTNNALPVENGALKYAFSKTTGWWNTLLFVGGGESANWLWYGNNTVLNLDVKRTSGANDLEIKVTDKNNVSATVHLKDYITASANYQTATIPSADFLAKEPALDFSKIAYVFIGGYDNWGTYTTSTYYFRNIVVNKSAACTYDEMVKVNQLGYLPDMQKLAIVSYQSGTQMSPTTFTVKDSSTNSVVYTGTLVKRTSFSTDWQRSGDDVFYGDFSTLKTMGTYYIDVTSLSQHSSFFKISPSVYDEAFRSALRFFYYARSGEEIIEPYAEGFTRPAYYENDDQATYASNAGKTGTRDIRGGWFDAGDPHKDMHAQPITMFMLLETLEDFNKKIGAGYLNIPDAIAGKSDLYALIKYQLDWFKKMYNADGSVQMWAESPNNAVTDEKCIVSDISSYSASTLAFTYAKAYRSFKQIPTLSTYADTLLLMAEQSWQWLEAHPTYFDPKKPDGSSYAYQKDANQDSSMRMNAAIELFETTGKAVYHTYFKNVYNKLYKHEWNDWQTGLIPAQIQDDWGSMGYYDYIFSSQATADVTIQNELKARYKKLADWLKYRGNNVEYSPAIIAPNHIFWGSNGLLMGNMYTLIKVSEYTNDDSYKNAAYENLHWVLGRNPVNTSMLSGFGEKPTYFFSFYYTDYMNQPHGYMTGGINEFSMQDYMPEPWKRYMFIHFAPWLEPGIYWQAEACWALGYFASDPLSTQLDEVNNELTNFSIYPNPASNQLIINASTKLSNQEQLIVEKPVITNMLGQIVYSFSNFQISTFSHFQLDVSQFPSGLYFINVGDEKKKFLIVR